MDERFAIVTYEVRRREKKAGPICSGLGFGFLIETPDGRAWCFPSPETRRDFPGEEKAFELNPERLRPQGETGSGRRSFVYALVS